jgi:hypothetical protein
LRGRRRIADHSAVCRLPSQPDVLDDVLGFRRASENAVGDAEEARARFYKSGQGITVLCGLHRSIVERFSNLRADSSITIGYHHF